MKKERKPKTFLRGPSYPGGPEAMRKFLGEQIKYPEAARKENIMGTVRLRIDINYQGKVTSSKILTSLGYGCDEEAQRVVGLLKFEVPKQRKIKAVFHKTMNIHFKYKVEKAKKVQLKPSPSTAEQQITYTISKKEQAIQEKSLPASKGGKQDGYQYTIEI
jgi:protein TonB